MAEGPLPELLRPLFWEIDFDRLRLPERETYVIERVLEYGDLPAVRWLEKTFPSKRIAQVVRQSRALSLRSANFWARMLDIPLEEIRCLSTSFQQEHRVIWQR